MKMIFSNEFRIIFPVWAFIFANNSDCSSVKKCVPLGYKSSLIDIQITNVPSIALQIYQDHGIEDKIRLFKSIDNGKTNRIFGYGVCKQAIRKLQLGPVDEIIVAFGWRKLDKKVYKRLQPIKNDKNNNKGLRMLECKSKSTKAILCHIVHAKDDFYYVFNENPSNLRIKACLRITTESKDYPAIEIKETQDKQEVDDMFEFYGTLPIMDVRNVCSTDKYDIDTFRKIYRNRRREICKKIMIKLGRIMIMTDENATCNQFDLHIPSLPVDKKPKTIKGIIAAKCEHYKNFNGQSTSLLWFFNTTTDNIYFTAVQDENDPYLLHLTGVVNTRT